MKFVRTRDLLTKVSIFLMCLIYNIRLLNWKNVATRKLLTLILSKIRNVSLILLILFEIYYLVKMFNQEEGSLLDKIRFICKKNRNSVLFTILFIVVMSLIWFYVDDMLIFFALVCAYFSKNIGFKKSIDTLFRSNVFFLLVWIIAYGGGMLVDAKKTIGDMTLGTFQKNFLGLFVLYFAYSIFYLYIEKNKKTVYSILLLFSILLGFFVGSLTPSICILLLVILKIILNKINFINMKLLSYVFVFLPSITIIVMLVLSYSSFRYTEIVRFNTFWARFNEFNLCLKNIGFHCNNLGINIFPTNLSDYGICVYMDNLWVELIFNKGIIYFFINIIFYTIFNIFILKKKDYNLALICITIYIFGFMENNLATITLMLAVMFFADNLCNAKMI